MKPARLWPLLVALVLLIGGALGLEVAASRHVVTADPIEIRRNEEGGDEDEDDGGDDAQRWYTQAPLDADHRRARLLAMRGEYAPALELLEGVRARHSDDTMVLAEHGHWLRRAGHFDDALSLLEQAQQRLPDNPTLALDRGQALARLGRTGEAIEAMRASLAQRPSHSPTAVALGTVLRKAGRAREAVVVLEQAARHGSNEERARALTALGRAHAELGEWDRARRRMREAVQRAPASVAVRRRAAIAFLRASDPVTFQAGLEHALAAKKLSPQSGTIHRIIGRIFEKLDRPREALDAYLEAVGLAPDDLVSRRRIVRLSLDFDDTRMARRHAQALLEHAADEPGSHFLAGLAASRDDDLEQARAHYEQAIELSPEPYAEAFYNIGLLERRAGRGEAAVAAYQEALRARPGYREAWNNLGLVLEDQGRTDEALQAFHRAIDLSDGYVAGRKNLAKCLSRMGRHAEAIEQLQALLRRTPGHRTSRLQLGVTLRRAGRAGEAVEVYRGLVREYPRYVRAWYNMGVALGALGHDDEARKAYQQALEHDPQHFASLKNLGLLESRHGLAAEARAHLSEALERAPADDEVRIKLAELHLGRGDYARCSVEARRVISQGARIDAARALLARCSSSQEGPGDVQ